MLPVAKRASNIILETVSESCDIDVNVIKIPDYSVALTQVYRNVAQIDG